MVHLVRSMWYTSPFPPTRNKTLPSPHKAPKGTDTEVTSAKGRFCAYPTDFKVNLGTPEIYIKVLTFDIKLLKVQLMERIAIKLCLFDWGESFLVRMKQGHFCAYPAP